MNDIIHEIQDMRYLKWTRTRNSSGTAGSFLKSYDNTGKRKMYYKLSDYDSRKGIVGHECVNEIIAQRLLDILGIEHLEYTLIHGLIKVDDIEYTTYMCRSYDFKEPGESKIPLEDYYDMEKNVNESPLEFCKRMNWDDYIYSMIVVDFLISNRDRHGANIEVLFNRKKKKIRPAPLFDHGLSFVCRCHDKKALSEFDVMQDVRIQSFIGGNSAYDNLEIVPGSFLKSLRGPDASSRSLVMEELDDVIAVEYLDKIWEMISERWKYIENIRNT